MLVVVDSFPARDLSIFFVADSQVLRARDPVAIVQIIESVEDRVVIWDIHDGALRENHLHGVFEIGLFLGSMKIVSHEKASAQQIVAKLLGLGLGQAPLAYLDSIE